MTRKKRNRAADPQSVAKKEIWQGFSTSSEVSDAPGNQRVFAARQANILDFEWFKDHPDREYRSRPSIPFEKPEWDGDSHLAHPIMMVSRRREKPSFFYRIAMTGNPQTVPCNERFLMMMWRHIATSSIGNGVRVSPAVHRDLLISYQRNAMLLPNAFNGLDSSQIIGVISGISRVTTDRI